MDLTTIPDADTRSDRIAIAPWHLLSVGVLALVWNGLCFLHFGITGSALPEVHGWTQTFLGAAMWGGFGGGLLLLMRSRWAVQAFTTALVGLIAASANLFVFAEIPADLYAMPMMLSLWVITLAMLFYTSRVQTLGELR